MPDPKNINSQGHKRPPGITFLSILYILVSVFHLIKFSQVILRWNILQKLPLAVSPEYLAGGGLVWFISGMVMAGGLWKGKNWSSPVSKIVSILFGLVFWIDRIWIAQPEGLALRWPVNLLLTIIGLGSIILILNQKTSQAFFGKNPAKIA